MKKLISLILLSCFFIVGCSKSNDEIGIRGMISSINISNDSETILIEGELENDTMYDKAYVSITKDTDIKDIETNKNIDISNLVFGTNVEVVFGDSVRESYPVQGDAKVIYVLNNN